MFGTTDNAPRLDRNDRNSAARAKDVPRKVWHGRPPASVAVRAV
jgi:hypothetical protein